jgi:hypothetical protein
LEDCKRRKDVPDVDENEDEDEDEDEDDEDLADP